jgi:hypothetical protein
MSGGSYDTWGALIIAPVLLGISYPIVSRIARRENDPKLARLAMIALAFKLIGACARYFVSVSVYYGAADAAEYDRWGRRLAPLFRQGHFSVDIQRQVMGTGFIRIVTGVVYAFTGPTMLGGYLVYSWLGFWGLFLFYRAFRLAFPSGDHRRYAFLVFFMPSLLFWPSSIGKESWLLFALGVTAYGTARVLASKTGGFPLIALGSLGTLMVRPHVTLIAIMAVGAAYLLRRPEQRSLLSAPAKVIGLIALTLATLLVMSQVENFFGVKPLDQGGTSQVLNKTETQTSQGGSEFTAARPHSPLGYGEAVVTVFFRPWPVEAHSGQALFASLEGVVLLGLILTSLRRLAAIPREIKRTPYVAYALSFTVLFVYAFSSIGNFGIMARQRVLMFPLLLVLLCVPRRPALGRAAKEPPTTARLGTSAPPGSLSYRR